MFELFQVYSLAVPLKKLMHFFTVISSQEKKKVVVILFQKRSSTFSSLEELRSTATFSPICFPNVTKGNLPKSFLLFV